MLLNCSFSNYDSVSLPEEIHIYAELPSLFAINIQEILYLYIWRIVPCNFQLKLRDALDIEKEDLIFKNRTLYKRFPRKKTKVLKILKEGGFLKSGYRKVISFLKQIDSRPNISNNFIKNFSASSNLTNIFQTFGEPDFHTGTSEGYDIFVYFGTHFCSRYKFDCNGILLFVVDISGKIVAYNTVIFKCPCYFKDANLTKEDNIYVKSKKSQFI